MLETMRQFYISFSQWSVVSAAGLVFAGIALLILIYCIITNKDKTQ